MRILIADSMPKVRRALTILLQEQPGWIVVGYAGNSIELYKKMKTLAPQLIVLDWDLPGLNHKGFASSLTPGKSPAVVALSWRPEMAKYSRAIGLEHFISKLDTPETLLVMVRKCEEGFLDDNDSISRPERKPGEVNNSRSNGLRNGGHK